MTAPKRTRNQKIMEMRSRQHPLTFRKIAAKLGISHQRVHQIWKQEVEKSIAHRMNTR